jgi:hypothetical protein
MTHGACISPNDFDKYRPLSSPDRGKTSEASAFALLDTGEKRLRFAAFPTAGEDVQAHIVGQCAVANVGKRQGSKLNGYV